MYLSRSVQKPFIIIAAVDTNDGLGKDNTIPWKCAADMQHFKTLTTNTSGSSTLNAVIMGRVTWETLPIKPLPERINIVISRTKISDPVLQFSSLYEAHQYLCDRGDIENQFIIGGAQLYAEALQRNWAQTLHLTRIPGDYTCDTFFPTIPSYWMQEKTYIIKDDIYAVQYHNYYTCHLEEQYIYQMRHLSNLAPIVGRNGLVHSSFQWNWMTDLKDGLPLFSTRRSFWKGICKELLFFIRGDTNSKHLEQDGINIWTGNTSVEFLQSMKLRGPDRRTDFDYQEGDMGPMYGWVWRHYGAKYRGMDADYTSQGFDQLKDVLTKLTTDPHNRRIMLTTYDPSQVSISVLAPCHGIVSQFYVREDHGYQYLDMYTYQRSADMFLGVNFNIPSHATLQYIISLAVKMIPGRFYYGFGDNHVYGSHNEPLQTLLERTPNDRFPLLEILTKPEHPDQGLDWIEGLKYEDFIVHDYKPQNGIKADMVV
jgi:dihydrofolate reductase/thymidylate synthase